jgi:hypothetical protein
VGVLGEDVEDEGGAVDGRPPQDLLQVAALGRRQLVVEDHGVGVDDVGDVAQLLGLALADEGGRIGLVPALEDALGLIGAGGVGQGGQLLQRRLGLVDTHRRDGHPDQHHRLPAVPLD